ncbi:MAG: methyltransferase domain-containing protein [Nitrospira sp.]|nr:methyltransferase domain-containing protein [bacterium]MBL7050006.1 methyltransferase domain-containing protein [Nitrospira sp.]
MNQQKIKINSAFSRSAETYDVNAAIQNSLAEFLDAKLGYKTPTDILELGCGTGNFTARLIKKFPGSHITAVDFSEAMIRRSIERTSNNTHIKHLCTDAEVYISKTIERFDLITSNATLQWFNTIEKAIQDAHNALKETGTLAFSVFGQETMGELQQALSHAYGRSIDLPTRHFPSMDAIQNIVSRLFSSHDIQEKRLSKKYGSTMDILHNMKRTGTSGGNRLPSMLTRGKIQLMDNWFKDTYGSCRISYQAYIVTAEK